MDKLQRRLDVGLINVLALLFLIAAVGVYSINLATSLALHSFLT